MLPALATMRFIRAYAGVRPLVGSAGAAERRAVWRGFALFDHESHGLDNLTTITGGRITPCRLMADASRTGLPAARRESTLRHRDDASARRAGERVDEPGRAPRRRYAPSGRRIPLLCECEMRAGRAVDAIYEALRATGEAPTLTDIGLRSRVGKGACQRPSAPCAGGPPSPARRLPGVARPRRDRRPV